jgi:hypothetical protein
MIDISHLPKTLQRKPEIRALTLRVYPGDGPNHYKVPGGSAIYDVYFFGNSYHCGCKAAFSGRKCAHAIKAQQHREQQGDT